MPAGTHERAPHTNVHDAALATYFHCFFIAFTAPPIKPWHCLPLSSSSASETTASCYPEACYWVIPARHKCIGDKAALCLPNPSPQLRRISRIHSASNSANSVFHGPDSSIIDESEALTSCFDYRRGHYFNLRRVGMPRRGLLV